MSADHRRQVEVLIEHRTQVAWQFTLFGGLFGTIAALAAVGGPWAAATALPISIAILTAVACIVWEAGWRGVQQMRSDLAEGRLATRTGRLDRLEQAGNTDAEIIVYATVDGMRFTNRENLFEGFLEGETIAVDHLPRSGIPLAARHA